LTAGAVADDRIQHYRVRRLTIASTPQMPVLADGILLDPGRVTVQVRRRSLLVIAGAARAPAPGAAIAVPAAVPAAAPAAVLAAVPARAGARGADGQDPYG
jgi:hypothetical protein